MPVFALQFWAYSHVQPAPIFYVEPGIQTKVLMLSEQERLPMGSSTQPFSLILMPLSLSACVQAFPDVRNLSSILYLYKILLFVLLLFYFLSTPCAWHSCFVLKWTVVFFFIEFLFSESGTIARQFPLVEPYYHWDYIFFFWFECHFEKRKILQPSSHTLSLSFLPQGFGCCSVSQSKACLSFYLTWEPPSPPQLYFEGRLLLCWLLRCERAGRDELSWPGTASVGSSRSLSSSSTVEWCRFTDLLPVNHFTVYNYSYTSFDSQWAQEMLNFTTHVVFNKEFSLGCPGRSVIGKQNKLTSVFIFWTSQLTIGKRGLVDVSLSVQWGKAVVGWGKHLRVLS